LEGRMIFFTGHGCFLRIKWGYFGNYIYKCSEK
jgi:hypothetical protein